MKESLFIFFTLFILQVLEQTQKIIFQCAANPPLIQIEKFVIPKQLLSTHAIRNLLSCGGCADLH